MLIAAFGWALVRSLPYTKPTCSSTGRVPELVEVEVEDDMSQDAPLPAQKGSFCAAPCSSQGFLAHPLLDVICDCGTISADVSARQAESGQFSSLKSIRTRTS